MQRSAEGNEGRMDWAIYVYYMIYMRRSWKSPWRCPQVAAASFRGHEERVVGVVEDGGVVGEGGEIRGVHISMGKFQNGFLKKHIAFPACILLPEHKYVRVERFDPGK